MHLSQISLKQSFLLKKSQIFLKINFDNFSNTILIITFLLLILFKKFTWRELNYVKFYNFSFLNLIF
jgi:hypothetical protein